MAPTPARLATSAIVGRPPPRRAGGPVMGSELMYDAYTKPPPPATGRPAASFRDFNSGPDPLGLCCDLPLPSPDRRDRDDRSGRRWRLGHRVRRRERIGGYRHRFRL